jgi:cyclic pyranopterin phosphate synthase
MVDVTAKGATERMAVAEGRVIMSTSTLDRVLEGNALKGDVLGVARLAGIMAAKRTHGLIPLCHPLPITKVEIEIDPEHSFPGFLVRATVKVTAQTGVEMEALVAASIACLTIYDMVKAVEKGMRIEGVRLLEKTGGKSGPWRAEKSSPKVEAAPELPAAELAQPEATPVPPEPPTTPTTIACCASAPDTCPMILRRVVVLIRRWGARRSRRGANARSRAPESARSA